MTTLHPTADAALAELTTLLGTAPSPGLTRLVDAVMAYGLPLGYDRLAGSPTGMATVGPDGIVVTLADVPLDEGVVAHELAHALLEMRGWPTLFAAEDPQYWVGRLQRTLASVLEHPAGIALQREYGIDGEAYETLLLERQLAAVQLANAKRKVLDTLAMTIEQELEYGIGLALMSVERYWRRDGQVEADFINALDLFPGARSLFTTLADLSPGKAPTEGWPARFLMGRIVSLLDDYMEIKGDVRPMMVLSHFVPAVHPDDALAPMKDVARVVIQSLPTAAAGEHSIFVLPARDGLPFGFRQTFADETAQQDFTDRIAGAPFAAFGRAVVPDAFRLWVPDGDPVMPTAG